MLVGDEYSHYYVTNDGLALMRGNDGNFRYVTTDADGMLSVSPMIAADKDLRSADAKNFISKINAEKVSIALADKAKANRMRRSVQTSAAMNDPRKATAQNGLGLFSSDYPTTGKVKSLVFLVEFKNNSFTVKDPNAYWTRMLNQQDFAEDGGTGSARDFFLKQSANQFEPEFVVYGPVKLPQNMSYYGGNDASGNDLRPEEMVTHAAELLKDQIDFSKYDFDNNGYVDNIYVFYAGYGEADGGPATTVWPHNWEVPSGPVYNGKRIKSYACSNELQYDGTTPDGIGTFCHEFSHVIGLPDLYATAYTSAVTPGYYSVMDQGSYNNDGRTPPNYSSFELNALKWIEPTVLNDAASVRLENLSDSRQAYLIPTLTESEFFLLENRQKTGNDKYIPGHGMLVWHIDFDQKVWDANTVNNNAQHQYVDLVEANNKPSNSNTSYWPGYPFPGTGKVTSFTSSTTPALKDWSKRAIDVPLTNITETDGIITFDACGGQIDLTTPEAPVLTVSPEGILTVSWQPVNGALEYEITVYTAGGIFGQYSDYNVGADTSFVVGTVQPEQEYFAKVRAVRKLNRSEYSEAGSVLAPALAFIYTAPNAIEATIGTNGSNDITFSWEALKDAVAYRASAEIMADGEEQTIVVDFGVSGSQEADIPEGWVWTGNITDVYKQTSTGYFGESDPSLKFTTNKATLTTPVFNTPVNAASFWLRGASARGTSAFYFQGRTDVDAEWQDVLTISELSTYNTKGSVMEATPAADMRQFRFMYEKYAGNAALDDIKFVMNKRAYAPYVTDADAGNQLYYTFTAPAEATLMRCYVTAVNEAGEVSRASNYVEAKTVTAINVAPAAGSITVSGRTVFYSEDALISAYTATGAKVAQGKGVITLPSSGLYIITTPGKTFKVIAR